METDEVPKTIHSERTHDPPRRWHQCSGQTGTKFMQLVAWHLAINDLDENQFIRN